MHKNNLLIKQKIVLLLSATFMVIVTILYFLKPIEQGKQETNTFIKPVPTPKNKSSSNSENIIPVSSLEPSQNIPQNKILKNGKHMYQTFNNCGPASLSMALSYFDINVSQQQLGNQLRPYQHPDGDNDDKSVTFAELSEKAEEYGFLTYSRPAGNIEMIQKFIASDIPVITKTWQKPDFDIGHYRVVKGYNKNKNTIIQDDSLQGRNLEYTYSEFNKIWQAFNYEFMVLVPKHKKDTAKNILDNRLNEKMAWETALQKAQEQIEKNSDDAYASFNLLTANYYLKNYQKTIETYNQIKNQLPRRMLWYQIEPILAHYQLENYDKVMEITQNIFDSENKAFSELHYLRAKIYEKKDQPVLAKGEYSLANLYNSSGYWKENLKTLEIEIE